MEVIIQVIMFIIFLITVGAWSIVGLIFWIPILTRATTIFAGMIVYATLTHQNADALREYLRVASGFYADGFRITKGALYPKEETKPTEIEFHLGRFILELLWTAVFWLVVLWISKPELIVPLTTQISSLVGILSELLKSNNLVLVTTIIIGGIILLTWVAYLYYRYDYLLSSKQPKVVSVAQAPDATIYRQLDRILTSLQELSDSMRRAQAMSYPSDLIRPSKTTISRSAEISDEKERPIDKKRWSSYLERRPDKESKLKE